jgi:hypothetical protein
LDREDRVAIPFVDELSPAGADLLGHRVDVRRVRNHQPVGVGDPVHEDVVDATCRFRQDQRVGGRPHLETSDVGGQRLVERIHRSLAGQP